MRDDPLLKSSFQRALQYKNQIADRRVFPDATALQALSKFDEPLPEAPQSPEQTINLLDTFGSPATVASTGGRYFGFVTGGALPVTIAAKWLTTVWDQNSALQATSPAVAKIESVTARWLIELLGLPQQAAVGFVSGATMANFSGLAAARYAILQRQGWDINANGLFGAPPIDVIVGEEVHASLLKALMLLGLGHSRVTRVAVDNQGRMRADRLPEMNSNTILCLQAGNVNSGAFDPADIVATAKAAGAWVHVDGAFGLWALALPEFDSITRGLQQADSWAVDAHKWLNTPYDGGIVFVREPGHLESAMNLGAAYLPVNDQRQPSHFVPEFSRRARAVEVWAALRTIGRKGLQELIGNNCRQARLMGDLLKRAGFEVLNDVTLNQVVVAFGDQPQTNQIVNAIQEEGTTWAGGTVWQGRPALRISVSSWATTDEDIRRSAHAIINIARGLL